MTQSGHWEEGHADDLRALVLAQPDVLQVEAVECPQLGEVAAARPPPTHQFEQRRNRTRRALAVDRDLPLDPHRETPVVRINDEILNRHLRLIAKNIGGICECRRYP